MQIFNSWSELRRPAMYSSQLLKRVCSFVFGYFLLFGFQATVFEEFLFPGNGVRLRDDEVYEKIAAFPVTGFQVPTIMEAFTIVFYSDSFTKNTPISQWPVSAANADTADVF